MNNFTIKDMTDLLYNILSKIKDNQENETKVVLQTPTTDNIFPIRVINTPIESVIKTQNAIPILKNFQITIEHWAIEQTETMEMSSKTDIELMKKNIIRTNTSQITFDEIIKKYKLTTTYEVRWEGLTNSFICIK